MKVIKISNYTKGGDPDKQNRDVDRDLESLSHAFEGRIRFGTAADNQRGENISGEFQVYTTNAVADTEDTLAHTVGAVPQGFIVINTNKGGVVYSGTTTWTSSNIYLKCSVASATVTLFLLK